MGAVTVDAMRIIAYDVGTRGREKNTPIVVCLNGGGRRERERKTHVLKKHDNERPFANNYMFSERIIFINHFLYAQ